MAFVYKNMVNPQFFKVRHAVLFAADLLVYYCQAGFYGCFSVFQAPQLGFTYFFTGGHGQALVGGFKFFS